MFEFLNITKALAEENRVRILLALEVEELCVCQIIELLELAPSTVSKHMSVLRQARLVDGRKEGRWMYYRLAKKLKLSHEDAAPAAMIGASNHFEVAIATSTRLFGLSSGAALATVVGVLIEVPVILIKICLKTTHWFKTAEMGVAAQQPTTG